MNVTSILMNKHSPLVSVPPSARIENVIELMKKNDVGSVVVISDDGQFEGIIIERDIIKAIDTHLSVVKSLQAKDIMSNRKLTCTVDDTEPKLMERMIEGGVQYLPVVDGGRVIAMVTIDDVVDTRVRIMRNILQELEDALHVESYLKPFTRYLKFSQSSNSSLAQELNPPLASE